MNVSLFCFFAGLLALAKVCEFKGYPAVAVFLILMAGVALGRMGSHG